MKRVSLYCSRAVVSTDSEVSCSSAIIGVSVVVVSA